MAYNRHVAEFQQLLEKKQTEFQQLLEMKQTEFQQRLEMQQQEFDEIILQQETDSHKAVVEARCRHTCPICMDRVIDTYTPCGHLFCRECIMTALAGPTNDGCPVCRNVVTVSQIKMIFL